MVQHLKEPICIFLLGLGILATSGEDDKGFAFMHHEQDRAHVIMTAITQPLAFTKHPPIH